MLSIAMFGNEDFFSIKGVIEGILNNFCFGKDVKYVKTGEKLMHPTRSADIFVNGVKVGYFGQLHPVIAEKFSIDKPLYVAEVNYDLLSTQFLEKILFRPISKFPSVERDLAVIINEVLTPSPNRDFCWITFIPMEREPKRSKVLQEQSSKGHASPGWIQISCVLPTIMKRYWKNSGEENWISSSVPR